MASTGFWPVKSRLKDVIDYAENPDKTIDKPFHFRLGADCGAFQRDGGCRSDPDALHQADEQNSRCAEGLRHYRRRAVATHLRADGNQRMKDLFAFLSVRYSIYFPPHISILSSTGLNSRPISVNAYSTRSGTSG